MGWDLIADIGGTNMRLAGVSDCQIVHQKTYPTVGELSVVDAVFEFIGVMKSSPDHGVIAAAGIVKNGSVALTNTGTLINEAEINAACNISNTKILNDFEAAAWSLADVNPNDIQCLQGSSTLVQKPRVIVGPGTGLGVGALVWNNSEPVVVQGEGGHVRLSPDTVEELEIFKALVTAWPEVRMGEGYAVEVEACVSGTGLPYLYSAIGEVQNVQTDQLNAEEIFGLAKSGQDLIAAKTIKLFTKFLGEIAGDMGVTFAANGGVYLAGGVIASNPWIFDGPNFLTAFNSGGRHSEFREQLPVFIYGTGQFGLNGAMNYLQYHR